MLFLNLATFRKINGAGIITIIKMISFSLTYFIDKWHKIVIYYRYSFISLLER